MYCHPERSEGSLYGLPTSCPLLFPDIVDQQASRDAASRGSTHCSRWLRCWYTSRVTMLVLHTETLRFAQGDTGMTGLGWSNSLRQAVRLQEEPDYFRA